MTPLQRADTFLRALDAYLVAWQEALAGYGPQPEVREERERLRRAVVGLVGPLGEKRERPPLELADPGTHGDAEFDRDTTPWIEDEPR